MKLKNNYRIDNKRLMVEVCVARKDLYMDINKLPLALQAIIVTTNQTLIQYIDKPSEYLKRLFLQPLVNFSC